MFRKLNRARAIRFVIPQLLLLLAFSSQVWAQPVPGEFQLAFPGENVDAIGPTPVNWLYAGKVTLQQNEVDGVQSLVNPNVYALGFNDYRAVYDELLGDALPGIAFTRDGGFSFVSGLVPIHAKSSTNIGYSAGADPNLEILPSRSGPGLLIYNAMAFDRDDSQPPALWTTLWYEHNRDFGIPFEYLSAHQAGLGTSSKLLDKPSMKAELRNPEDGLPDIVIPIPAWVDPRNPANFHDAYSMEIPAARVHLCYSLFVGNDNNDGTKIHCVISDDAMQTVSHFVKLSESIGTNQGTTIATQDFGRIVSVFWSRFEDNNETAAIMVAQSFDHGESFGPAKVVAEFCPHNVATGAARPRSNSLPIAVASGDGPGDLAVYFASRNDATETCNIPAKGNKPEIPRMSPVLMEDDFDSFGEDTDSEGNRIKDGMVRTSRNFTRIMMVRSTGNNKWTTPVMIDPQENSPGVRKRFQQIMPAGAAAGGTETVGFFDSRFDQLNNFPTPIAADSLEDAVLHLERVADPLPGDPDHTTVTATVLPSGIYEQVPPPASLPPPDNNLPLRRSVDFHAVQIVDGVVHPYTVDPATYYPVAEGTPGAILSPSVRVSKFATRQKPGGAPGERQQVERNYTGARLFNKGKAAFLSDYSAIFAAMARRRINGDWVPNQTPLDPLADLFPSRHFKFGAAWTSNRFVRGKVFYTGCDEWDESLQMWVAGEGCASAYAEPELNGMLFPLVGEDGSDGPAMTCTQAQAAGSKAGPLTRNQTIMFAALTPGVSVEVVSAIKRPVGAVNSFVLKMNNGSNTDRNVLLSLPAGQMVSFDKDAADSILQIPVFLPRGSGNARTVLDFGNADTDPGLPALVILTATDADTGDVLARVALNRESLSPLENVQTNDPDDPLDLILDGEAYELILKREIASNQALDLENLDLENTVDLLDLENLDLENLDLENRVLFLDLENLDLENLDLENSLYANLDLENLVLNLDLENLDLENRLLYLDLENLDLENLDLENLDLENLDLENLDLENLDLENLDLENLDLENFTVFAAEIENLDLENLDLENAALGDPVTQVSWTVDSGNNTVTGVDIAPAFSPQLAAAMDDAETLVLLTVRKGYMKTTVSTVQAGSPEVPYCTPVVAVEDQVLYSAVMTQEQVNAAVFNGTLDDPDPLNPFTPGFVIDPDGSAIVSLTYINAPPNFNAQALSNHSGMGLFTQAGLSIGCEDEIGGEEAVDACEIDVIDIDTTPPVITLTGGSVSINQDTVFADPGFAASDDRDGDITSNVMTSGWDLDTSIPGVFTIFYDVADAEGNPAVTLSRTVTVLDTEDPVLTLSGTDPDSVEAGSAYPDPGASATDNVGVSGLITSDAATAVNTAIVGMYTVTYSASDAAGNTGTVTRTVNVVDTTPPVITLIGSNPMTLEAGDGFVDPGANIFDIGDPGVAVTTDESGVNTSVIGSYTVYYNATDAYGNPAAEVTRSVVVEDTVPPVIDIDIPPIFTPPLGDAILEPGETTFEISWPVGAVDLQAGLSISCNVGGSVIGPSTADYDPATGTLNAVFSFLFSAGTTDITCTVTDQGNNPVTSDPFQVLVEDRPIIDPDTLPDQPLTVEANDPSGYVGPTNTLWAPILATDLVDPNPIETACTPADDLILGVNTISCIATDSAGNMSDAVEFEATIVDTTAPVITTVQPDITVEANAASGYEFPGVPMVGLWSAVQASDIVDGVIDATCTPNSVSNFALNSGEQSSTHTVTCIARDVAGNPPITSMPGDPGFPATAFTTFTVTVEDNTAPVINAGLLPDPAPSSMPREANGSGGFTPTTPLWTDPIPGAAADIVDVTVNVTCAPGPSSVFALGDTDVTCSSTDARGNMSVIAPAFTVSVGDSTPPAVTINVADSNPVEATGPTGASVSFTADATDIVSGSLPASCSVGGSAVTSPHVFGLGDSTLTCIAIDGQGVQGSAMATVTVEDNTPPDISAAPLTVVTTTASADVFVAELTPSITASDLVDGSGVTIACLLPTAPTTFAVSDTTDEPPYYEVECTATDSEGNEASTMLQLTIAFAYDIIIDVPNGNKRAGSTIPLDFWYEDPLNNGARVDPATMDISVSWFGPFEGNNCTGDNTSTGDGTATNDAGNSDFRISSQLAVQYSWQTPEISGSFLFVPSPPGTLDIGECVNLR